MEAVKATFSDHYQHIFVYLLLMQFAKAIISLLLLFTYSIGFAHDLIPHCHADEAIELITTEHGENHHHLEHHNHAKIENLDDDDVLHENHLDDSLFDYVVCLLSKLQHNQGLAHLHFIHATTDNDSEKECARTSLLAVLLVTYVEFTSEEPFILFDRYIANNSQSPFIVASPHRGPPFLSC